VASDPAAFPMRSAAFASRGASRYSRATQQGTSFSMAMSAASRSALIQRASHCQPAPVEHVRVSLLGAQAVAFDTASLAHLFESPRLAECPHGGFSP